MYFYCLEKQDATRLVSVLGTNPFKLSSDHIQQNVVSLGEFPFLEILGKQDAVRLVSVLRDEPFQAKLGSYPAQLLHDLHELCLQGITLGLHHIGTGGQGEDSVIGMEGLLVAVSGIAQHLFAERHKLIR